MDTGRLEWWRQQSKDELGGLHLLLRRLFSALAINADVENAFSAMRMLFFHTRSGMAESAAEGAMVLKYNMEEFGMWSPAPDSCPDC